MAPAPEVTAPAVWDVGLPGRPTPATDAAPVSDATVEPAPSTDAAPVSDAAVEAAPSAEPDATITTEDAGATAADVKTLEVEE